MTIRAKTLLAATVLLAAAAGAVACTDLTVEPKSSVTSSNIFKDPSSYETFVAKIYGGLAVSGQEGPAGSPDIKGIDEGFSHYLRLLWQMEELPTDEAIIAWNDEGVKPLNTQLWPSNNQFLVAMYSRVYFQVAMANEFLRETTDDKLAARNVSGALRDQIKGYRAEARFLRALSYWHGLDLFGSIPLVKEDFPLGTTPPQQATRADLFNFVESELKAIRGDLPATAGSAYYGRATRGAVDMVLANLYLNAKVYTGTERYADARTSAEAVISSGVYSLDPSYRHLFLADNNTSPEIVFAVPQDGKRTQTYGGTTFLVHASVGGSMDPKDYGIEGGWWGLRARAPLPLLFPDSGGPTSADRRGQAIFKSGQTLQALEQSNFNQGYGAPKFKNVTSTGAQGSAQAFVDTDYPMFRLGEAYLIYAEAVLRGGGGTRAQALTYVNALRQRAYGNTTGNIADAQLTLDFLLDERGRELYWEGHRRTDLIRYGRFSDQGVWEWKGGVPTGKTTESFRNLYPLPASELIANPNLKQNTGY